MEDSQTHRSGARTDELLLTGQAQAFPLWASPQAHDSQGGSPERVGRYGTLHGGRNLADDVTLWPTPNPPNGGRTRKDISPTGQTPTGKHQMDLGQFVVDCFPSSLLDQPTSTPGETSSGTGPISRPLWQTPNATVGLGHMGGIIRENWHPTLEGQARGIMPTFHRGRPTKEEREIQARAAGNEQKRLNPRFVDWLMGIIPGWTDAQNCCAPGEMASYRSRLRSLLRSSLVAQGYQFAIPPVEKIEVPVIVRKARPQKTYGEFSTLYVDPPWHYPTSLPGFGKTAEEGEWKRPGSVVPYKTLSMDQIALLPIGDLAGKSAHLYLWTTNYHLPRVFELGILRGWGFKYSTLIPWVKKPRGRPGFPAWPVFTEYLIYATRGSFPGWRAPKEIKKNWYDFTRGAHSKKPDEFYDLIEIVSPAPRLELFARADQARIGWETWGDECPANPYADAIMQRAMQSERFVALAQTIQPALLRAKHGGAAHLEEVGNVTSPG